MKGTLFFFLMIIFFQSCKNDLDVIDDYKETTIIYSLLNTGDTSQFIRIQKSFLGEGNAYLMAQNADSIYPDTANITVSLQKIVNGIPVDSFIYFHPVMDIIKDEGLFTDHPSVLYKSSDNPLTAVKEDYIDRKASYALTVTNRDQIITATSNIVNNILLDPTSPLLYPSTNINLASENPFRTDVTFPVNGKIMNLTVRFHYTEYQVGTGLFENKTLDYILDNYVASNDRGGQKFTYEIAGDKFFLWLKTKLKNDPSLIRPGTLVTLDFIFTVGSNDFYNYYSVGNSSVLLNDVIPSYTNIHNGLGIFSSRTTNIYYNKKLTGESVDSLNNGQYTGDLFD
jgi:hypothetical protein